MKKQGIIKKNETWRGVVRICGDVIVPNGITVTIAPGTKVLFDDVSSYNSKEKLEIIEVMKNIVSWLNPKIETNKAYIIVKGLINIEGNKDKNVTIGNKGWCGGIVIDSEVNCEIKHCIISNATCGLYSTKRSKLCISNNLLQNCYCSIMALGRTQIVKNNIKNNVIGIIGIDMLPDSQISENILVNNSEIGIGCNNCTVEISRNTIQGSSTGCNLCDCIETVLNGNDVNRNKVGVYNRKTRNIKIKGNNFIGNTDKAIINHWKVENIEIAGNVLKHNINGIECFDETKAIVKDNTIIRGDWAILLKGRSECDIGVNSITNMRVVGIFCREMSTAHIYNNVIRKSFSGVRCDDETQVKLKNNTIVNDGCGIDCFRSTSVEITNNNIVSDKESCLRFRENTNGYVEENSLGGLAAMQCGGTAQVKVIGNEILISDRGVEYNEQSSGVIERNRIFGKNNVNSIGISVSGESELVIKANKIDKVCKGIVCNEGARVKVENNKVKCKSIGIDCEGMSNGSFIDNDMSSKREACVRMGMSSNGFIDSNIMVGIRGVEMIDASEVVLKNNRIVARDAGISCSDQSNVEINKNNIKGILEDKSVGIIADDMAEVKINENKVEGVYKGIICTGATNLKVENNKIFSSNTSAENNGISKLILIDNEIANQKEACVRYNANGSGIVKGNMIYGHWGIEVLGSSEVRIENNNIRIVGKGIRFIDQSNGALSGNKISANNLTDSTAISIGGLTELHIENNEINNISEGIFCEDGAQVNIINNNIESRNTSISSNGMSVVNIQGNSIVSSGKSCIHYNMSGSGTIEDNTIRGWIGVETTGAGAVNIIDNMIDAKMTCVRYHDQSIGRIEGNRLVGVNVIEIDGVGNVAIKENTLTARNIGILCIEQGSANIEKNDIRGTSERNGCGIIAGGVSETSVLSNDIGLLKTAVKCIDGAQLKIDGNKITECSVGVESNGLNAIEIHKNTIECSNECIRYGLSANGNIADNKVKGKLGIVICGSCNVLIKENIIEINDTGIACGDQSSSEVVGNVIKSYGNYPLTKGINVLEMAETNIRGNKINDIYIGIANNDEANTTIERNVISSYKIGIDNRNISCIRMSNNDISVSSLTDGTGIRHTSCSCGIIENNRVISAVGIEASDTSEINVENNIVIPAHKGIVLKEQSTGRIVNNNIDGKDKSTLCGIEINNNNIIVESNVIKNSVYGILCANMSYLYESKNDIAETSKTVHCLEMNENVSSKIIAGIRNVNNENDIVSIYSNRITKDLQNVVLNTWNYPFLKQSYRGVYKAATAIFVRNYKSIKEIESIYLRRGLTNTDWIPGSSDIDLIMIIRECVPQKEVEVLKSIWKKYSVLKKLFPFIGELQIVNRKELGAYFKNGSLRALEARHRWCHLYGEEIKIEERPESNGNKNTADVLTEMFNSYRILCDATFRNERNINCRYLEAKAFIDILKYCMFMKTGVPIFYESRNQVIDSYPTNGDENLGRAVQAVKNMWVGKGTVPENDLLSIFIEGLILVHSHCKKIENRFGTEQKINKVKHIVTKDSSLAYGENEIIKLKKWIRYCDDMSREVDGCVKGAVLDNPGLLYVILTDSAIERKCLKDVLEVLRNKITRGEITSRTPFVILSETMYQSLLLSLHLETPFNYFKLGENERTLIRHGTIEERYQYGVSGSCFMPPTSEYLMRLIKESLSLITMSIRIPSNSFHDQGKFRVIYNMNRILGLHLAVEKNIIAMPYIEHVVEIYGNYYEEQAAWLKNTINAVVDDDINDERYFECYPMFMDILSRINNNLKADIA